MVSPKIHRRDTLRKAKASYKKRGGPVISEKERRQIERRAELRERAEKIKAKDEKRKANREKRGRKLEREKEAKQRQGYKEPEPELPRGQFTLSGFAKKSKSYSRTEACVPEPQEAKGAGRVQPEDLAEECITVKVVKSRRRVRCDVPETNNRAKLSLRLKSPPLEPHPSTPQSARQDIPSSNLGSPLVRPPVSQFSDVDDWASLFPSDTQVGRELREHSPSMCGSGSDSKRQSNAASERFGADFDVNVDELLLTQSIWDSLPSDTQVQRELDESPLLPLIRRSQAFDSYSRRSSTTPQPIRPLSKEDSNSDKTRDSVRPGSKVSPQQISLTSSFGMEDFLEDEAECLRLASSADGFKVSSTQWLPTSTAEVSAFFDMDIED